MESRITIPKVYAACFACSKRSNDNRIIQGLKLELRKVGFVPIAVINNFYSNGIACCAACKIVHGGNISCSWIYSKISYFMLMYYRAHFNVLKEREMLVMVIS